MNNIYICEKCGLDQLMVTDSRKNPVFGVIRRMRACLSSGFRITTYEISSIDFEKLAGKG